MPQPVERQQPPLSKRRPARRRPGHWAPRPRRRGRRAAIRRPRDHCRRPCPTRPRPRPGRRAARRSSAESSLGGLPATTTGSPQKLESQTVLCLGPGWLSRRSRISLAGKAAQIGLARRPDLGVGVTLEEFFPVGPDAEGDPVAFRLRGGTIADGVEKRQADGPRGGQLQAVLGKHRSRLGPVGRVHLDRLPRTGRDRSGYDGNWRTTADRCLASPPGAAPSGRPKYCQQTRCVLTAANASAPSGERSAAAARRTVWRRRAT